MPDHFNFTFDMSCKHCSTNVVEIEKVQAKMAKLEWDIVCKTDTITDLTRQLQECREAKPFAPIHLLKEAQ